jgi:hypothetical protein
MSNFLENTHNLESQIKEIECSIDLIVRINEFLDLWKKNPGGKFSNLYYRSAMHYIIDNIKKTELAQELDHYIEHFKQN